MAASAVFLSRAFFSTTFCAAPFFEAFFQAFFAAALSLIFPSIRFTRASVVARLPALAFVTFDGLYARVSGLMAGGATGSDPISSLPNL